MLALTATVLLAVVPITAVAADGPDRTMTYHCPDGSSEQVNTSLSARHAIELECTDGTGRPVLGQLTITEAGDDVAGQRGSQPTAAAVTSVGAPDRGQLEQRTASSEPASAVAGRSTAATSIGRGVAEVTGFRSLVPRSPRGWPCCWQQVP